MSTLQERGCKVVEFVGALRQFAKFLEKEPEMAFWDASGDFFVGVCALMYDDQFLKLLEGERAELVRQGVVREAEAFEWDQVVCAFMTAVAEFACGHVACDEPAGAA